MIKWRIPSTVSELDDMASLIESWDNSACPKRANPLRWRFALMSEFYGALGLVMPDHSTPHLYRGMDIHDYLNEHPIGKHIDLTPAYGWNNDFIDAGEICARFGEHGPSLITYEGRLRPPIIQQSLGNSAQVRVLEY